MSEAVRRARSAIGRRTIYELGRGGRDPLAAHPADELRRLDCSGFVAWALGTRRRVPESIGWIETSRIVRDATGARLLFAKLEAPELGAVLVYGDRPPARRGARPRQGHCGIVAELAPLRVVHCSVSNFNRTGDAIQETDGAFFFERGGICAAWRPPP